MASRDPPISSRRLRAEPVACLTVHNSEKSGLSLSAAVELEEWQCSFLFFCTKCVAKLSKISNTRISKTAVGRMAGNTNLESVMQMTWTGSAIENNGDAHMTTLLYTEEKLMVKQGLQ
jgi:hypothetical protein